jgi:hypothetical protein
VIMQLVQGQRTPHFASLRQPPGEHQSPEDVLSDPSLAAFEKRSILSSWASDRHAVESSPWLRRVPGVHNPLPLAGILSALRSLEDDEPPPRGGAAMRTVRLVQTERDRHDASRAGAPFRDDALAARLAAHRNNLERYRRIMTTPLTDLERAFVKRRISEERAQIDRLQADNKPPLASSV